jgi:hypothetical protein
MNKQFLAKFYAYFQDSFIETHDDKRERGDKKMSSMCNLKDIKTEYPRLKSLNESGGAVYFNPNPCDGKRRADSIKQITWVFADIDDGTQEEQLAKIKKCELQPTILVKTGKGYHAYWHAEELTRDEFTQTIKGIIKFLDSDPAVKDPNRLLRLPPFKHMKGEPKEIEIVEINSKRYSKAELLNAFPYEEEKPKPICFSDDDDLRKIKSIPVGDVLSALGVLVKDGFIWENGKQTSAHINERENYINRFSGKEGSGSNIDAVMVWGNKNKKDAIEWLKKFAGIVEKEQKREVWKNLFNK